jgi:hypothetical protein
LYTKNQGARAPQCRDRAGLGGQERPQQRAEAALHLGHGRAGRLRLLLLMDGGVIFLGATLFQ